MHSNIKPVQSLTDFFNDIEFFDLLFETVIFRGQASVQGNLLPSIARKDPKINTTKEEILSLQQLRLQGASLVKDTATDMDLLITAQHFGLQTRLLDWTTNPLVALWFACNSTEENDAYVYALEADNFTTVVENPFLPGKAKVIQPPMNNPRIIAQHGWFTLHNYSKKVGAFVPLEKNIETKEKIHEYKIDGQKKSSILASLDRVGISAKTIYPDLEGLCKYVNWKNNKL